MLSLSHPYNVSSFGYKRPFFFFILIELNRIKDYGSTVFMRCAALVFTCTEAFNQNSCATCATQTNTSCVCLPQWPFA